MVELPIIVLGNAISVLVHPEKSDSAAYHQVLAQVIAGAEKIGLRGRAERKEPTADAYDKSRYGNVL
jgi:aromatic ring-cleaving dioxygenase